MKRLVLLFLFFFVLSAIAFADKNPKKRKGKFKNIDTTIVVQEQLKTPVIKGNQEDSLQTCADSLLLILKSGNRLATPHLDAFMTWLMNGDTVTAHQEVLIKFSKKLINDVKEISFQNDSIHRQFVAYHEALAIMNQIKQTLSIPYDVTMIDLAEDQLEQLRNHKWGIQQSEQLEVLTKGVRYYKNKIAVRRVGDIIDEIYELKADTTLFREDSISIETVDSLFGEIVHHQGRNHLINYVPYAVSLRQKIMDAFFYDNENHVILEQTHWDAIEAVRKEIELIIEK